MKINLPISGCEVQVGANASILSTTDPKGCITYVNPAFINISGFTEEELLGSSHNIVRHPEMPPAAFEHLWQTLKSGRSWMGMVKNRCKNGDHYWVSAYATPVMRNGAVVEYQSVRTEPLPQWKATAEQLYRKLAEGKQPRELRPPLFSIRQRLSLAGMAISAAGFAVLAALGAMPWLAAVIATGVLSLAFDVALRIGLGPLDRLARHAKALADNPLSQVLYTGRNDQFGQIDFALYMLSAEHRAVVARISDSARRLHKEASDLVAAVECSNTATLQHQNETAQVASAIGQMASSVQDVARSAQLTASAASVADQEAASGLNLVEQTRRHIVSLAAEVQQADIAINQLQQHSQEIDQVLAVIQGIAEQTNLLALNAAIEAARAGEAGRGFAVVADQVRTLASSTQESTAHIKGTIDTLRDATERAVTAMRSSQREAKISVEQMVLAARTLGDINQRVTEISDMNVHIAAAVEEQSAVGDSIQRNLDGINLATQNNVQASHRSHTAAGHVAGLAEHLQLLAEQFMGRARSE